jgi:hypothetical protein
MGTLTHVIRDRWVIKFAPRPVVDYLSVLLNDGGIKIPVAS